jgi:hypothetical protein
VRDAWAAAYGWLAFTMRRAAACSVESQKLSA